LTDGFPSGYFRDHGEDHVVSTYNYIFYGMEFSLEEPYGLMCPQHRVSHDSADGGDSQPGDIWEIRKITGMRKVGGVEEFRVAWQLTWMPESDLGGARDLVDEFRARLSMRD
jgi:hypothetical protein